MTTFLIILAVYLLSVVAMYFITKFMFLNNHPRTLAPVWVWVTPVINTICTVIGFFLCWDYFPITGLEYWKERWAPKHQPTDTSTFKDVISEWSEKEIESAASLLSKRKKSKIEGNDSAMI